MSVMTKFQHNCSAPLSDLLNAMERFRGRLAELPPTRKADWEAMRRAALAGQYPQAAAASNRLVAHMSDAEQEQFTCAFMAMIADLALMMDMKGAVR